MICVNGQDLELQEGITLQEWLTLQKTDKPWTVVEYNGKVLSREMWSSIVLRTGDVLEVLVLLGGG